MIQIEIQKANDRRMARKKELEEQQEIPQDLSGLKRQALQKLCKSFGLKANGKVSAPSSRPPAGGGKTGRMKMAPFERAFFSATQNVEMVRLLEEFRDKNVVDQPDFVENR